MTKDAFYFPHFSNARHDRKIKRVIKELGVEGYGIYFMLLEVLREQRELKYPVCDIDLLADEFRTSEAKITTIVGNYDLFIIDQDEMFFSPKQLEYLQPYFDKSIRAKEAANKRWQQQKLLTKGCDGNANAYTNAEQTQSDGNAIKVKESKVKESKVKEREEIFYNEVAKHARSFSKKILREFFDYWSEPNKSGTNMRFELEKTWDLSRRLSRWAKREAIEPSSSENQIPPSMRNIKRLDQ